MLTVPNLLSGVRLLLVPLLVSLAWSGNSQAFLWCLIASLVSDLADGFFARLLKQTSELGAKLDSWGDLATYLTLPVCAWWLQPEALRQEAAWLLAGLTSYVAAILLGFLKFGRLTSYHTWSGKLAAVLMGAVALMLFGAGKGWPLRVVMPIVVLTQLEEMAITASLSEWRAGLPSLWHALQIRRQVEQGKSAE
ncbi:MAG: CDP-alcohol phosphatidyltransferase family protein [Verrucomicrobia bacterium]|nr:CDP-alcohol phosphatidyltransferase family protein [Verrucomicrobiota bacterium]